MTGWASGCSHILYLPASLPIPVNLSGNSLIKSSVDMMHLGIGVLAVGGFCHSCCLSGCCGLLGFCWDEWSQQHSSLGPQLTSCILGDPREQDQMCLQCTSMSGSCVVGLLECLVARGWGHRGFCTEKLETLCRQLAWFIWGPGQWAGHLGLVCFGCSSLNRWRGSMLPPDLVSILTWTEAVP